MVKQGLLEPPKPKVKVSNLMRVLTAEATADPTAVEQEARSSLVYYLCTVCVPCVYVYCPVLCISSCAHLTWHHARFIRGFLTAQSVAFLDACAQVRKQMAERADAHEDRNLSRMLTPAEKKEKKARKLFVEAQARPRSPLIPSDSLRIRSDSLHVHSCSL